MQAHLKYTKNPDTTPPLYNVNLVLPNSDDSTGLCSIEYQPHGWCAPSTRGRWCLRWWGGKGRPKYFDTLTEAREFIEGRMREWTIEGVRKEAQR